MSEPARSYRELHVWRKGIELVKSVYALIACFPRDERYAPAEQLRRSVVSIPSNIAEGQCRQSPADFRRFLLIALGSLAEVDTQLVIAAELGYITEDEAHGVEAAIVELRRMLYGLIRTLPKR